MPDLFVNPEEQGEKSEETSTSPVTPLPPQTSTQNQPIPPQQSSSGIKENHVHALSHYCEQPSHVVLEGKNITDVIKLFVRRHIVTNIPWIVTTIVLFLIPPLIQILLTVTNTTTFVLPGNFILIFILFYYLIAFTYAFINFLDWFFNIIIISNTEIIDIDYKDVVFHDVAATNVNLVEDVNYVQVGFIRSLFNFGDLFVQTAGGKENIEAYAIPQPARIARIILDFIGKGEAH